MMKRTLLSLLCGLLLLPTSACNNEKGKQTNTDKAKDTKESRLAKKKKDEQRKQELDEARLDEKKQEHIFDLEHVTFVIEQVLGAEWKKAFKAGDHQRLTEFCFAEFSGQTIEEIPLKSLQVSVVTEKTRSRTNEKSESGDGAQPELDAKSMNDYLLKVKKEFSKIGRVKFRVLQISQPIQKQPLWTCKILIDVVGESAPGKPKQYESEQTVVFEIENEAELTTHPSISDWKIDKETFRDATQYLTEEVTEPSLVGEISIADNWQTDIKNTEQYWFQYAVEDFDRDGKLDFSVACNAFYPRLLYNAKGNRFVEVSEERSMVAAGGRVMLGPSFGCAWIDFNNDGYPDLINGLSLFESKEGKSFSDIYSRSGLALRSECMGILVADYDCDGLVDLYVLYQSAPGGKNDVARQWVNETMSGAENELWKNMGGGRFVNVTKKANAGGGKRHTHAASWFFYDDDHYPDLYIANDFGKNVLLRNKGDGTFEDVSDQTGTSGYATSMGVSTGDLNNDGRSEIYVANMYSKMGRRIIGQVDAKDYPAGIFEQIKGSCAGNRLYTMGDDAKFKEIGEDIGVHDVGWAYGPALTDFDQDGLLDIYATTGFMSFQRGKPDG